MAITSTSIVTNNQPVVQQEPVAQPVVLTEDQKIAAAINKLSKTALDNLWEENVTNSAWYAKFYGLICYAWNRSTAVEADKTCGATIEQFNKASVELVHAVATRGLTQEERTQLGTDGVQFLGEQEALNSADRKVKAEDKLKAFYAVFKERATQLNINDNSDEFGIYAAAAQKIIRDQSNIEKLRSEITITTPYTVPTRINTTVQAFNENIFNDMVNGYASQPIANITIDSFKDKAGKIKGFFKDLYKNDPEAKTVYIETKLRQAIKEKHNAADFTAIRGEWLDPAATAARFVTARGVIEQKLNAEKDTLTTELSALRGTNGFNGTINTALLEKNNAETLMNTAYAALIVAMQLPALNTADRTATIAFITSFLAGGQPASTSAVNVGRIQTLLQDYTQKATEFNTKNQAHAALVARLAVIATYSGSDVYSGGRLHAIDANLQPLNLDGSARQETQKHADFYNELNQAVTDANKVERSQTLHAIIDTNP